MAANKTTRGRLRRLVVTAVFNARWHESLDYYAAKSADYPRALLEKLRRTTLPQLVRFPESGRTLADIRVLGAFTRLPSVAKILNRIRDASGRLSLREIILDKNFTILYGYDKSTVVLLAVKHTAKRDYSGV